MADSFLGSGFPFPLRFENGELTVADGDEKIRESIYTVLMTRQGERPMRPDFGSRMWQYVFDLSGESNLALLKCEIVQSILQWEHRVEAVSAEVDTTLLSEGKLLVTVSYRVRGTNHPGNLVFPFYLEEGGW